MVQDHPNLIQMKGITKSFYGTKANDNIDFDLKLGEIHALLGENGTGKTTLMNILTGVYFPESGKMYFKGKEISHKFPGEALKIGIGMVHQRFSLIGNLTVLENIILGLPSNKFHLNLSERKKLITEYAEKYNFSVDLDAIVDKLPIGVKQKVEILKMLVREVDVLIVDEPTTVLTKQETDNLIEILKKIASTGKGVIFISHKMKVVRRVADRITVLRKGKNVGTVLPEEVSSHELAKMMVGRIIESSIEKTSRDSQKKILQVENLHVHSDKGLLAVDSLSFEVFTGEILGIAGVSGNGQTELAEALTGNRKVRDGKIWFKDRVITDHSAMERIDDGISYIPADRVNVGVAGQRSIWENLGLKIYRKAEYRQGYLLNNKKIKNYAEQIIEKYDILQPGINFPALLLSGGNLQKLIIGREIEAESELYVCVYPTRGLDVGATDFVRNSIMDLRNSGKAVVLISGDLDEIFSLSDRIAVMFEGDFVSVFENGKYDIAQIGLMMSGHPEEKILKN